MNFFKVFIFTAILLVFSCINLVTAQSVENKKQLLKKAEAYYDSTQYESALPLYLKLLETDPDNVVYNLAAGICYINAPKNKINAIPYLEKASAKRGVLSKEGRFYLGRAYHLANKFDEAVSTYEKYLSSSSKSDERYAYVQRQIEMCQNGRELIKTPVKANLVNLAAFINSPYPEYCPLITGDDSSMIFTSRRPGSIGDLRTENNGFYEDIYISYKVNDTIWSSPVGIGSSINSPVHDACVGISTDGQELYIYSDDEGNGNIYVCTLSGDVWSAPRKLNANINSPEFEPSACVSPDGNTLYFVSDRKGGYGGKDIYKSLRTANGDWGPAVNLGKSINTKYDEDGPFMHADNSAFYFSSTGHSSIGGYDVFVTSSINDTTWNTPKNVGFPINTVDDDIYFVMSPNGKHAYYSSIKENGVGEKDIYMVDYGTSELRNLVLVKGRLKNSENENVKATIEVRNKQTNKVIARANSNAKTGKFLFFAKPGTNYELVVSTPDKSFGAKGDVSFQDYGKYYEVYQEVQVQQNNSLLAMKSVNADSIKKATVAIDEEAEFLKLMNQSKQIASDSTLLKKMLGVNDTAKAVSGIARKGPESKTRDNKNVPDDRILFKTLFFATNTPELTSEGKREADAIYKILKDSPSMNALISGHADNRGDEKLNLVLSEKRAQSVYAYLKSKGVKPSRMKIKGFGESEPFATNETEEGRQANRRVEVKVSREQ